MFAALCDKMSTVETETITVMSQMFDGRQVSIAELHRFGEGNTRRDRCAGPAVPVLEQILYTDDQINQGVESGFIIMTCQVCEHIYIQTLVKCRLKCGLIAEVLVGVL